MAGTKPRTFNHHGLGDLVLDDDGLSWTCDFALDGGYIKVGFAGDIKNDSTDLEKSYRMLKSITGRLPEIKLQVVELMFGDSDIDFSTKKSLVDSLKLLYAGFWSDGALTVRFDGEEVFGGHDIDVDIGKDGSVSEAKIK